MVLQNQCPLFYTDRMQRRSHYIPPPNIHVIDRTHKTGPLIVRVSDMDVVVALDHKSVTEPVSLSTVA